MFDKLKSTDIERGRFKASIVRTLCGIHKDLNKKREIGKMCSDSRNVLIILANNQLKSYGDD